MLCSWRIWTLLAPANYLKVMSLKADLEEEQQVHLTLKRKGSGGLANSSWATTVQLLNKWTPPTLHMQDKVKCLHAWINHKDNSFIRINFNFSCWLNWIRMLCHSWKRYAEPWFWKSRIYWGQFQSPSLHLSFLQIQNYSFPPKI